MKRVGLLFNYDWDALGFAQSSAQFEFDEAGFDLFSFPSNAHLLTFDMRRFAQQQAKRGKRRGWAGVVSHHETLNGGQRIKNKMRIHLRLQGFKF